MKLELEITKKQSQFMNFSGGELLFGGACGGGKSYAQIIDAFIYAFKFKGSKQLILRRTTVELEKSILRTALSIYPRQSYKYNVQKHEMTFANGSILDFGYLNNESDTAKYQSSEYDVIRFDELTHFSEFMYLYMMSRLRGANDFPKSIKSTTNPGGIGHEFVKERFISLGEWNKVHMASQGGTLQKRLFIPSKITDNKFLMEKDKGYLERLENLPKAEKEKLLYGNWDVEEGRFFPEFSRDIHVIAPQFLPSEWQRFCAIDYGLDMLACYFIAVDRHDNIFIYKEIHESNLIVSAAAKRILAEGEKVEKIIAPKDLFFRNRDSGRSTAEIFKDYGITLLPSPLSKDCFLLKEWLKVISENGRDTSKVKIFPNCTNLIKALGEILVSKWDPCCFSSSPHLLTHSVDALKYFLHYMPKKKATPTKVPSFFSQKRKSTEVGQKIKRI